MILIHQVTQARTHKKFVKVHYFKNGKYIKSSEVFPYDDALIKALLKGHSTYALTNVATKADLDFKQLIK